MVDLGTLRQDIQTLANGDDAARRQAIHAIRILDEPSWADVPAATVNILVEALEQQLLHGTKQTFVRQEILIILGNLGTRAEAVIPVLIDFLKDGVADGIREEAATALGKMGKKAKPAVEQLVKILPNCRTTLAVRIILALSGIGAAGDKVRAALVDLWLAPDQSQHSQVQIAWGLCKLKIDAKGLLPFLTRTATTNQDSALRKSVVDALGWCNKTKLDVVPALLKTALTDKDDNIRLVADASLAKLGLSYQKAVVICAEQLHESVYAEIALTKSGELAVPALIESLTATDAVVREKAARILGSLGEVAVAAAPALTKSLRDKSMDMRLAAAKGLWNVTKNATVVVPVLIDLLDVEWTADLNGSETRRRFLQTVIEALGRIGPPAKPASSALNKKTKDKNRLISESARSALAAIASTAPPAPTGPSR